MIASPDYKHMSLSEYLEWEERQEFKYEYLNGEVYGMTGGTIPHNIVAVNLTTTLKNSLRGGFCRVYMADVKVCVSEEGSCYYPDVVVSCDERDRQATKFLQYPSLIVEVLSPDTEAYDRGGKFTQYRRLQTLREYILINTEKVSIECFRLNDRGFWELHPYEVGDEIEFTSIDLHIPISLVYEDVQFPN